MNASINLSTFLNSRNTSDKKTRRYSKLLSENETSPAENSTATGLTQTSFSRSPQQKP